MGWVYGFRVGVGLVGVGLVQGWFRVGLGLMDFRLGSWWIRGGKFKGFRDVVRVIEGGIKTGSRSVQCWVRVGIGLFGVGLG